MNEKKEKAMIALSRLYANDQIDKGEFLAMVELVMQEVKYQYVPYYINTPFYQQQPYSPPFEVTCSSNTKVDG